MTLRTLSTIFLTVLVTAILINHYERCTENKLLQLFKRNVNYSLCALCLGNGSFCNSLNFQLNYKRHADVSQYSNLLKFIVVFIRIYNYWTNQLNDKIFFGTFVLQNGTGVRAVAKSPGYYYCEMFEQIVNISTDRLIDTDTMITNDEWGFLLQSVNKRNLTICSKYDENLSLHNFFNSVINAEDINNSQLQMEIWINAHLSVELLFLKILSGYNYVPNVFGTCGRVYFVEDCGYTLQYYLNKMNLSNRLLVAKELLKLALEFTDGTAHPYYSFYFTDLTADNIALRFDETTGLLLSLKIIDWSDIIVVFNNHSITSNENLNIHICEHINCKVGCLSYRTEDICQAKLSDFNVYAICKEFLIDGKLLHDVHIYKNNQNNLNEVNKKLKYLVNHCLWNFNDGSNNSRLDTAKLLILTIESIFNLNIYNIV